MCIFLRILLHKSSYCKYMYLDYDKNKVTKTGEGGEIHNSSGTENKGIVDSSIE